MVFKTSLNKLESGRRWRKNNPEKFKMARERWKQNNLERYKELQRVWERNNKEKRKIASKKWRGRWKKNNKDKVNEYKRRRDVKKRGVIEVFSKEDWEHKLKETTGICPGCNKFVGIQKLTIDHNPPISKVLLGFVYTIENVQPLCSRCNSSKGNKIIQLKEMY